MDGVGKLKVNWYGIRRGLSDMISQKIKDRLLRNEEKMDEKTGTVRVTGTVIPVVGDIKVISKKWQPYNKRCRDGF